MKNLTRCLLAVVVACLACSEDDTTGLSCTDIGCESGLYVELEGLEADSAEISVQVLDVAPWTIGCDRELCTVGVFFPHFTPDHAVITVRVGDQEVVQEVRPSYSALRPNGPDCEPTCWVARVDISVESL